MRRKIEIILIGLLIAGLFFSLGWFFGRRSQRAVQIDAAYSSTEALSRGAVQQAAEESAAAEQAPAPDTEAGISYPINLNTATLDQLLSLPGIGETKARRILDYRAAHGPFQAVSELMNIEGIGQKTLDSLLDYITVE